MKLGFWRARIPFLSQKSNKMYHLLRLNQFMSLELGRGWKERQMCCCQCMSKHCCPFRGSGKPCVHSLCLCYVSTVDNSFVEHQQMDTYIFVSFWSFEMRSCHVAGLKPFTSLPQLAQLLLFCLCALHSECKGITWALEAGADFTGVLRLMEDVGRRVIAWKEDQSSGNN